MEQLARTTRKEQKEKTRLRLVETAEGLFADRGIGNTSTAHVAQALEVSHGTVFIHFPTRDELILAVVERFGDRLSAELGRRFHADLPLKEMLEAHVSVLSDFEDFYLRLIAEGQSLSPKIRSLIHSMNASLSYRFFRAAQAEMKKGKVKKLAQAPFFNTWISLLNYHILNRDLFSEERPLLKAMGKDLVRHFLLLIQT
jgi:AcrR family transcriptional regulator